MPPSGRPPYPRHRPVQRPVYVPDQRAGFGRRLPVDSAPSPTPAPIPIKPVSPPPPERVEFKPPEAKKVQVKLRIPRPHLPLRFLAVLLAVLVVGAGVFALVRFEAARNNPDRAFRDALRASLSTRQIQEQVTANGSNSTVDFDFTNATDPLISSQATVDLAGSEFQVNGYGSAQNTYISYSSLPSAIPASLSSQIKNGWVQLRSNGVQSPGVSAVLANLADPRYQTIGPVVVGDFAAKTRDQLLNFIQTNHVYSYDTKQVTKATLSGQKVFVYPIKVNGDFVKTLNQSAAVVAGFSPTDIQAGTNSLDNLSSATIIFYIGVGNHRLAQVTIAGQGQTKTISYGPYNQANLPAEPQTQLTWQNFASDQLQLEAAAASHQSAAARDNTRRANLAQMHAALATYFSQNNAYPTFADLSSQSWVAANLGGIDPDVFRDPAGTTLAPVNVPGATLLAYQPVTAAGKSPCDNNANVCAHYNLIEILSNGQPLKVQDP